MRKLLIISSVGILVTGSIIWISMAGPVLVEWHYGMHFGSICDPPFVILNPLRDREHERVADAFLAELKIRNLKVLDDLISDRERLEQIRAGETNSEILSWFAAERNDTADDAAIEYFIERKYKGGCQTLSAFIGLKRIAERWKVTSYNPTY